MHTIDMHTHTFCPQVEEMVAGKHDPLANPYRRDMSAESRVTDADRKPTYRPMLNDAERRFADMARMKVDFQVIAPAPAQQHYWADEDLLVALSVAQNEHVAKLVAAAPAKFAGMGTLPMAFPERAAREAERAVGDLGLRGFQIDTRVNAHELSERAFDPVWEALARLGVPVFIHPLGFSQGARLSPFFMINSVGQPLEEVIAGMHLIAGGVLDRHPELKVVIGHGGGYLPYHVGRLDHAWKVRPEVRALTPRPPSEYLKRIWFDSCVFRSDHLSALVSLAGVDKVMLGSDYPFDMGDEDPTRIVFDCDVLNDADRAAILSENAASLFGILDA